MRSIQELASLAGRGALVVGGSGHLGRIACDTLLELGAVVASADLPSVEAPSGVTSFEVDLLNEASTRNLIPQVVGELGGLDVLVHCAGYTGDLRASGWATDLGSQTVEEWDRAYRVNTTSAFVLAQEARTALSRSKAGSLVLLSSIYGFLAPDPRLYSGTTLRSPAGYGASKAGLLQLTRHLAAFLAPETRVNAISPGGVFRHQDPVFVERYEAGTPLGRLATEEDIKGAIAYLSSDLSAYTTGTNLVVDGGRSSW
jgi:NAD(P)-dependent dehydrogenase (short-subunit alcohol dehydrogenase family)